MKKRNLFVVAILFGFANITSAEIKHSLGLSGEYLAVDSKTAEKEGVGEDAGSIHMIYTASFTKTFFASIGLGAIFFDDEDEFKVVVEEERFFDDDRIVVDESDVTGLSIMAEAGVRYPLNDHFAVAASVGYRFVDAERAIDYCDDCPDEDVNIDGGVYLSPMLTYLFTEKVQATLGGQFYLSGDLETSIFLGFNFKLN